MIRPVIRLVMFFIFDSLFSPIMCIIYECLLNFIPFQFDVVLAYQMHIKYALSLKEKKNNGADQLFVE